MLTTNDGLGQIDGSATGGVRFLAGNWIADDTTNRLPTNHSLPPFDKFPASSLPRLIEAVEVFIQPRAEFLRQDGA